MQSIPVSRHCLSLASGKDGKAVGKVGEKRFPFGRRLSQLDIPMMWIDTHTHTYDREFGQDPEECVREALASGVEKLIQGGVDLDTLEPIWSLCEVFPGIVFPTIGLHPTEVKEDYLRHLDALYAQLRLRNDAFKGADFRKSAQLRYAAVGEIGMDLYWDKTFLRQQEDALRIQLRWAKEYSLPVVLHVRQAFEPVWHILRSEQDGTLRGVFHCYSGSEEQARRVVELGFYFGIGGVLTFKNSLLPQIVRTIPPDRIVLETDSPYLAPVPFRGKPNRSAYIPLIGRKLAECLSMETEEVARITTRNACRLFGL